MPDIHLDLYITMINFQATKQKSIIWEMFIANLLPNSCYLINVIILSKEHIIFFVSPVKNLSIPNEKIRMKLLFYNCGSASWLA